MKTHAVIERLSTDLEIPCERIENTVHTALGIHFPFGKIQRLHDGFFKYTYILTSQDELEKYIFQAWKKPQNHLPVDECTEARLLWPEGLERFIVSTEYLLSHGIKVPRIIHADFSETNNSKDLALIEYIYGHPLSRTDRKTLSDKIMTNIGDLMGRLHGMSRSQSGLIDKPDTVNRNCLQLYRSMLSRDIEIASAHDDFVNRSCNKILVAVDRLLDQTMERKSFHLVHGDLNSNHIIITPDGTPCLIDHESSQFLELEYEYCRFEMGDLNLASPIFKAAYLRHVTQKIDIHRVLFYRIAICISLIAIFNKAIAENDGDRSLFSQPIKNARISLMDSLNAATREKIESSAFGRADGLNILNTNSLLTTQILAEV